MMLASFYVVTMYQMIFMYSLYCPVRNKDNSLGSQIILMEIMVEWWVTL
mgnify:CR=1 FL=1